MVQRNGGARTAHRPSAKPKIGQRGKEIQEYGTIARLPIGLDESVCQTSVEALNQVLADTITLRDLYKKHHWQVAGPTFYQLHLLFDKHYEEQTELVDLVAERIQMLGGISLAMAADVAEETRIAASAARAGGGAGADLAAAGGPRADPDVGARGGARRPTRRATTAPTTCWSATSSAPTRCRCGSWPSTWSTRPWWRPIRLLAAFSTRLARCRRLRRGGAAPARRRRRAHPGSGAPPARGLGRRAPLGTPRHPRRSARGGGRAGGPPCRRHAVPARHPGGLPPRRRQPAVAGAAHPRAHPTSIASRWSSPASRWRAPRRGEQAPTWERFGHEVERMRYRGGQRGGYAPACTTSAEWIADGASRGLVRDLGGELGGVQDDRPLRFMTEHRASYPALADDAVFGGDRGDRAGARRPPAAGGPDRPDREVADRIETGDVLAFATAIPGLDVTHSAFACRDRRRRAPGAARAALRRRGGGHPVYPARIRRRDPPRYRDPGARPLWD